jgi:phage gp29-like protein
MRRRPNGGILKMPKGKKQFAEVLPKKPVRGELMDARVLADRSQQLNLAPFSGAVNPSMIWDQMMRDDPGVFAYYRDLEEKDDQIAQCLETRKNGVLSRERQLVAASKDAADQKVMEFVKEVLAAIPNFDNVLAELLDAPAFGLTVAETIWQYDGARIYVEDLKARPPEWFLFNPVIQMQNGPLRLKKNIWDLDGVVVPEHKFVVWSFRPRYGNRRGRPLLRRLFWPSWIKRNAIRLWLKYAEKGPGTIAVKYRAGSGDEEQRQALKAAEDISATTAVAFPEGFTIEESLLKAARSVPSEIFRALLKEYADAAIAKIILGQTLTSAGSDQGAGSRALGQVHQDVRLEIVRADAGALMTAINDQVVRPLVTFNFGPDTPAPKWEITVEEPEDLDLHAKRDQILQQMGTPIPKKYALSTYGIPELEEGDEILEPRAQALPGLGARDSGLGNFSEREDSEKDLAKLEKGAVAGALNAYAALIKRAVEQASKEVES